MTNHHRQASLGPIYLSWFLLALFFGYQYFLRVTPSIMVQDICHAFQLNAAQFALIPATYLYAYGLLQIPLGFILDSVGIKKTMLMAVLIGVLGVLLFFVTENVAIAYFARFLIGLGGAGAFIAPLKLAGDHLPPGKRGVVIGLTVTFGTIGALLAGKPQSALLQYCGWREIGLWSAMGGLVILLLMIVFMPKSHVIDVIKKDNDKKSSSILAAIKQNICNKNLLLYGMLAFTLYAPLTVICDTWGVTYLAEKYCFSIQEAAGLVSFVFIGLCLGSLVIPGYFEKRNAINRGIFLCVSIMCISFSILVFVPNLSMISIQILLMIFGFCSGGETLCFTGVTHVASHGSRGIGLGIANTINMVGAALLQQSIGKLLDFFWSGETENNLRIYRVADFNKTFIFFIFVFITALMIWFLAKDKSKQNVQ